MKKWKEMKRLTKVCIISLIVLFSLILSAYIALPFIAMRQFVDMHVNHQKVWIPSEFGIEAKHFFVKTDDDFKISAWEVEAMNPKAVIICLSGIQNPSATAFFGHARMFKNQGYASVITEMRAHGRSDGDRICCGYKEYHDVAVIVKYIKSNPNYSDVPIVVMGLSMGAGTAINSIGEIPEIDGLISLSAFSSWEDMFVSFLNSHGQKFIGNTIRPFVMFSAWIKYNENIWRIRPKNEIKRLGNRPALLMHTTDDDEVPFDNFRSIMANAPSQVETFVRRCNEHFITAQFIEPEKDKVYASVLMNFLNTHFAKK